MKRVLVIIFILSMIILNISNEINAHSSTILDVSYKSYELNIFDGLSSFLKLYIFALTILVIILGVFALISRKKSLKIKSQNKELTNFYELRKTFIDVDNRLIYLKDDKLRYIFVNKAVLNFYEKDESEIIGKEDYEILKPDLALIQRNSDLNVIEKKIPIIDEFKYNAKVYRSTKFLVKLLNGNYGIGAYISDITREYRKRNITEKTLYRNTILLNLFNLKHNSISEQLNYVISEIIKLTESKYGFLFSINDENNKMSLSGCSKVEKFIYDNNNVYINSLLQEVKKSKKALIINNTKIKDFISDIKRIIVIPIIVDDKIVSIIALANKEEDYNDYDTYQVSMLMNGVWNVIKRRELIVELQETNVALKTNEEKLQLILNSTAEGIFGIDTKGNCTFCNNSFLKLLGYKDQSDVIGKNIHTLIHHSDKDGSEFSIDNCDIVTTLTTGEYVHKNNEVFWRVDETCFDVEYYSYPQYDDGQIIGAVVSFKDITNSKKIEKEILYLSYHDSLTGLYNRRYFENQLIVLDNEANLPISIIMGDVNGLKLTNDIFGHKAGDELLRKAANVMKKVSRSNDVLARWGGDEFIIILPKTKEEEVKLMASEIKSMFSQEHIKAFKGSISLGYYTKYLITDDIKETLENAEEKMYMEKSLDRKNNDNFSIDKIIGALKIHNEGVVSHLERVSKMCEDMGKALNMSESEIRRLKDSGYLHDIGKLVIDENVLNKKIPLSEADWHEIKKHPVSGFRILNSFDDTLVIAKYVLNHHERWDGNGYPKGLKGEAIPRLSRIISVVESYDAMINGINYNKPYTKSEAIEELQKNSGTQFDPTIVDIFIKMLLEEKLY